MRHISPLVLEQTDSDVKMFTTTISDNRHMFVQVAKITSHQTCDKGDSNLRSDLPKVTWVINFVLNSSYLITEVPKYLPK